MTSNTSLVRPLPQSATYYDDVLKNFISCCSTCSFIHAVIRHGSFPGDIGISDIDVIVVIDEDKELDLLFLNKLKRMSYLLDVMFVPCTLLAELSANLSLSNPVVLYSSEDSNELIFSMLNTYIPSPIVRYSESISAYLHKYSCLLRLTSSRSIDLRKTLLCAKSVLRSIKFIGFHKRFNKSFHICSAIHRELRSNSSILTDNEVLYMIKTFIDLIYSTHPHILSQYNEYLHEFYHNIDHLTVGPLLDPRIRGIRLIKSPFILLIIISKLNFLRSFSTKFFYFLPKYIVRYADYIRPYFFEYSKPIPTDNSFQKHIKYMYALYAKQRDLGLPISYHSISRFL